MWGCLTDDIAIHVENLFVFFKKACPHIKIAFTFLIHSSVKVLYIFAVSWKITRNEYIRVYTQAPIIWRFITSVSGVLVACKYICTKFRFHWPSNISRDLDHSFVPKSRKITMSNEFANKEKVRKCFKHVLLVLES